MTADSRVGGLATPFVGAHESDGVMEECGQRRKAPIAIGLANGFEVHFDVHNKYRGRFVPVYCQLLCGLVAYHLRLYFRTRPPTSLRAGLPRSHKQYDQ